MRGSLKVGLRDRLAAQSRREMTALDTRPKVKERRKIASSGARFADGGIDGLTERYDREVGGMEFHSIDDFGIGKSLQ